MASPVQLANEHAAYAASLAHRLKAEARAAAARFAECDAGDDFQHTFEEFYAMQPAGIKAQHTRQEIRSWFSEMDAGGNGDVGVQEFFAWVLSKSSLVHGVAGVLQVLQSYDSDGSGYLDSFEFQTVCDDLGFGAAGHEIFLAFDADLSGYVNYSELLELLQRQTAGTSSPKKKPAAPTRAQSSASLPTPGSPPKLMKRTSSVKNNAKHKHSKQLQMAIAWNKVEIEEKKLKVKDMIREWCIDTSGNTIISGNADRLGKQIGELLRETGRSAADLFPLFTPDHLGNISLECWEATLDVIGYQGDKNLGRQVYENLFKDGEGRVGLDQVFLLVNGRQCNLRRLRGRVSELAIDPTQPDALLDETSEWNAEQLRRQLQFMLLRAHVSPVELLAERDSDESGELSKREFLVHMRKHFHFGDGAGQRIWDTKARFTAGEIFDLVAEGDKSISCLEMERWLDKNWPDYSGDARPAPRPMINAGDVLNIELFGMTAKSAKKMREEVVVIDSHTKQLFGPKVKKNKWPPPPSKSAQFYRGHGSCSSSLRKPKWKDEDYDPTDMGYDTSSSPSRAFTPTQYGRPASRESFAASFASRPASGHSSLSAATTTKLPALSRLARTTSISEVVGSLPPSEDKFETVADFNKWFESNWPGLKGKPAGSRLGLG